MIRFTKMHGIGNDYIYINGFEQRVDDPAALAPNIADRHFGVGADGLILVLPPDSGVDAHVKMRMFNADGSESEMCGNGIRCVCKLAHDRGISTANPMRIQTGAGVLELTYAVDARGKVNEVTVDMGEPCLAIEHIPAKAQDLSIFEQDHHVGVAVDSGSDSLWIGTLVSMGNPHIVFYGDRNPQMCKAGLQRLDLQRIGPLIEEHPAFPRRINAHFVQVHSRSEVTMRTWERGSGITLACGTGAAAVCVAGARTGRTGREILAHLPGGDLKLRWDEKTKHVFKTGPAVEICTGEWLL